MQAVRSVLSGRLLCAACASYTFAIAVYALFSPSLTIVLSLVLVVAIVAIFKKLPYIVIILIVCVSFAGGVSHFSLVKSKDSEFASQHAGRYVTLTGQVTGSSVTEDGRQSVYLTAHTISCLGKTETKKMSVILYTDTEKTFSTGDFICFSDIFTLPEKSNSHSFDYGLYLHTKNISASFSLPSQYITLNHSSSGLSGKITTFSEKLADKIRSSLGDEEGEVAAAITLGDKSGFSDDLTDVFTRSGISHIVAVSGMHLSVLTGFFFFLASKSRLHYKIRNIFGILLVIIYMALTGFSPSVTRAGIMTTCVLIASTLDKKEDVATSFFLSAAIILANNPYTVYSASFLLSYAALAGILIFSKPLRSKLEVLPRFIPGFIKDVAAASFSASITTLPILAYMFNGISLLSLLTNILVVPLVNIIFITVLVSVILGAIYAPFGVFFAHIPKLLIKFVMMSARAVSSLPYSYINVRTPTIIDLLCFAALSILFYLIITDRKPRKSGVLLLSAVVCAVIISVSVSYFSCSVTFFDIGQGDCALIKVPGNHYYLIDTGPNGSTTLSALRSAGLNKLDIIFISHSDKDHAGGLKKILESIPTRKVVLPRYDMTGETFTEIISVATKAGADVEFADRFFSYDLVGNSADVIWPSPNEVVSGDDNNNSLVLNFNIKGNTFLFTGDIGTITESDIMKTGEILDADVLKVAHHGSDGSSSDTFLNKVSASYCVISAGKDNRYGHPHHDVLARLESSGGEILRTDTSGDIKFIIDFFGNMRVKES